MRENFHPLGRINFGHEIGECQLRKIALQIGRDAEHAIVLRDGLPVALASEFRRMSEIASAFFAAV